MPAALRGNDGRGREERERKGRKEGRKEGKEESIEVNEGNQREEKKNE